MHRRETPRSEAASVAEVGRTNLCEPCTNARLNRAQVCRSSRPQGLRALVGIAVDGWTRFVPCSEARL